jgi:hypothetical protein
VSIPAEEDSYMLFRKRVLRFSFTGLGCNGAPAEVRRCYRFVSLRGAAGTAPRHIGWGRLALLNHSAVAPGAWKGGVVILGAIGTALVIIIVIVVLAVIGLFAVLKKIL